MKNRRKLKTATQIFKMLVGPFVFEGMTAVDCTVGNGHDTLFLAEAAGPGGRVYGFDVQASAIESTKKRVEDHDNISEVTLFHKGHEKLKECIHEDVDIVVYNLGYLPRHDKSITTMTETTIESVKQAMSIIKPGGLVSIIAYPGHEEGANELAGLSELLKNIDQNNFDVLKSEFINQKNRPPILFLIEKR
ncbi:class I SAM-dependent methyltransferase [Fusibacter sp. JL216-2]|uniref:tRNA (mnm(5)s(2)U34)-methyltransferase n=1 Tax=Fusibacter sp. JL216-2 TaxID=3071453 RepID=UPI003D32FC9D